MLADEGLKICVNTLRKVTAGMGEMLARLTKLGSVKVSGNNSPLHFWDLSDRGIRQNSSAHLAF